MTEENNKNCKNLPIKRKNEYFIYINYFKK